MKIAAAKINVSAARQLWQLCELTERKARQGSNQDLRDQVKSLKHTVLERDIQLQKSKEQNESLLAQIGKCYSSKEVLTDKLATANGRNMELTAEIEQLKSEAEKKDAKIKELTDQLMSAERLKTKYEHYLTEGQGAKRQRDQEHEKESLMEELVSLRNMVEQMISKQKSGLIDRHNSGSAYKPESLKGGMLNSLTNVKVEMMRFKSEPMGDDVFDIMEGKNNTSS